MLRSDLCSYSDAYIAVKAMIRNSGTTAANRRYRNFNFKNNAPFRSCMTKINYTI